MPRIQLSKSLPLQLGGVIPKLEAQYATWGNPKRPTIMLFCSMSNSCFATRHPEHTASYGRPWWPKIIGAGSHYGIDTELYHVVSISPLGSPFGSTSALSAHPDDPNHRWGKDFPMITPADQAAFVRLALEELGYGDLRAIVGGSMGGMQALEFAAQFPDTYKQCIAIACTPQTSPSTVALRAIQRSVVALDPLYNDGEYDIDNGPVDGLKTARQFGLICYTSKEKLDNQFSWERNPTTGDFEIMRYLRYNANKFTTGVTAYDANCYMALSKCMDHMNLGEGFASFTEGALRIPEDKELLLLSYDTDRLTPPEDTEKLAHLLEEHKREVYFEVLETQYGHDAFLVDDGAADLNLRISHFLDGGVHEVHRTIKQLHEH